MDKEILPGGVYITIEVRKLLRIGEQSLMKKVHSGEIKASKAGNKFVYVGQHLLDYLARTQIID